MSSDASGHQGGGLHTAAAAVGLSLLAALIVIAEAGAADFNAGRTIFTKKANPPCALCHTLKEAGALGQIGPSLDEMKPDVKRVVMAVRNGIGQMPAYTSLTDVEIEALASYVVRATSDP